MSSINSISPEKLARLTGTPRCPALIDVRLADDLAAEPKFVPGACHRDHASVADWASEFAGRAAVVICKRGGKLSEGVAAWLRHAGASADVLEGGHEAWANAKLPLVPAAKLPPRDRQGRTLWVTRSRPKVDRIACPWLIRRFVDPSAIFLFVTASEVEEVGQRFGAAPFDIENVFWSHRGELCTFDVMVEEFGLDTARPDLSPEAPGLLAASLGLSRMYSDDLEQLDAGLALYDTFYRWCRDATDETHNWPSHKAKAKVKA